MKTGTNLLANQQPVSDRHIKTPRRKKPSQQLDPKIVRLASHAREFRGNPRRSSGILDAFIELLELMSIEASTDLPESDSHA